MNAQLLFIGGAPKSGTTFLFNALAQHSAISPSSTKETYFFLDPGFSLLHPYCNIHSHTVDDFVQQYFDVSILNQSSFLLEGTPHLIWQQEVVELLKNYPVKIIFIIREPIKRVFSSFNFSKNNLGLFHKNISFYEFVKICLDKDKKSNLLQFGESLEVLANEIEHGKYYPSLRRYHDLLGSEHIFLLTFEDFISSPTFYTHEIFKWLKLSPINANITQIQTNPSKAIKNIRLHYFLKKIQRRIAFLRFPEGLKKAYFNHQQATTTLRKDDEAAFEILRDYYSEAYMILNEEFDLAWE